MKSTQIKSSLILFVLCISILSLSSSCKKDETTAKSDDIVGTWELTELTIDGYLEIFDEMVPATGMAKDISSPQLTFNSDGTFEGSAGTYTIVYFEKSEGTQLFELPGASFSGSGTWERNGNTLKVNSDSLEAFANDGDVNIVSITGTAVHISGTIKHDSGEETKVDMKFARK